MDVTPQNRQAILLAIGSSEIGGAQKVFLTSIKELFRRNHELIIALPQGPLYDILKSYNLEIQIIDLNSLKCFSKIAKLLKQKKVYIVNTYLTKCSILFSFVNLIYRKPICCSLHNAIIHEKLNWIQKLIYPLFYYFLYKICDGIIVNSLQNKAHFVKVARIRPEFIKVIFNGIDIDDFNVLAEPKPINNKFQIGYFGRLSIEKGVSYLIEALTRLSEINYECIIVGDGPQRTHLEDLVKKSGLSDKVKFLGFQNNIADLISPMNVVVVPSINEAFGMIIIEAFAMKKVVIASNVGGIPELIVNEQTGLLFPPRDISALVEKMLYVYNNKEESQMMAMNAFIYFKNNLTSSIMVENTIQYYYYIVNRPNNIKRDVQ